MFKRFKIILLVILMITIQFPSSMIKAYDNINSKSSISTKESTTQVITSELSIPSLTQWVLDEPTNTLYSISKDNKTLYFINAATMKVEKSSTLAGSPTDIIKDNGKLYIALDDTKQILEVDMATRTITKEIATSSDPYRIVKDGSKLYYAEYDQWCDIYEYDINTNAERVLISMTYCPDLAINTEKHILYAGESNTSGGDLIYYNLTDSKVIGRTNYDNGIGYEYPIRSTLFDGANVYYAGRDFTFDNPQRCIGDYESSVIFAKNNFTFTKTSIYDANTHVKLGDYGSNVDLVEASGTVIYLYNSAAGSIKSYNNSSNPIDNSNIISIISGKATVPIQSNTKSLQITSKAYSLEMKSNITQWVLDETTNTLCGISKDDKAMFFVNAATMNLEKSVTFTSGPTDIILDNGKIYISLDDINQIAIFDLLTRQKTGTVYTISDPYRIVIDGNKLYYAERDQWCKVYAYDLTTNTEQILTGLYDTYEPDLAINTSKHILYIGESGSTGSDMIYYSTSDNKIISKTNYDNGYGFMFPIRCTLFDGEQVYFAERNFNPEDATNIIGNYGKDVISARNGWVFSNMGIYDSHTNKYMLDFGTNIDLAEISSKSDLYLYNKQNNSIIKVEQFAPPVVTGVNPNTGFVNGGTAVNITGTGLSGVTKVYFGSVLVTNIIVNSDTSITVTSPISSGISTVDITVAGPSGKGVIYSNNKFIYKGLTINPTAVNGSITGVSQIYNYGATATLIAVAAQGYMFKNWTDKSGNVLSTNQVYSFKIYDNLDIQANFVEIYDVNKDGKVDVLDLAAVAKNYNMKSGNASWDPKLDFNKDGTIDIFDLVLCSKNMNN